MSAHEPHSESDSTHTFDQSTATPVSGAIWSASEAPPSAVGAWELIALETGCGALLRELEGYSAGVKGEAFELVTAAYLRVAPRSATTNTPPGASTPPLPTPNNPKTI